MDTKKFTGAGCIGPSMLASISNATTSPTKENIVVGATWPFVMLSISGQVVSFRMMNAKRDVSPSNVEKIFLSKYGYVFFRTTDKNKAFGFATLRLNSLLKELKQRGYNIDPSCVQNVLSARISLTLMMVIPAAIFALIATMAILKPNGV